MDGIKPQKDEFNFTKPTPPPWFGSEMIKLIDEESALFLENMNVHIEQSSAQARTIIHKHNEDARSQVDALHRELADARLASIKPHELGLDASRVAPRSLGCLGFVFWSMYAVLDTFSLARRIWRARARSLEEGHSVGGGTRSYTAPGLTDTRAIVSVSMYSGFNMGQYARLQIEHWRHQLLDSIDMSQLPDDASRNEIIDFIQKQSDYMLSRIMATMSLCLTEASSSSSSLSPTTTALAP